MAAKDLSYGSAAANAGGILYTDRRQFYLNPNVVKELWKSVTPFTTISMSKGVVSGLADPLFKMFEHRSAFQKQTLTVDTVGNGGTIAAADDTGQDMTFSAVAGLDSVSSDANVGLTCEVWNVALTTKRGVVLLASNSAGTYKAKNLGASNITGIVQGDVLYVIGNARGEGATSPEAWADDLKIVWGATQIFRTPIEITGTLHQAALRGYSNELARLREEKMKEHKMQVERSFLFGQSAIGTGLADSRDSASNESFGDTAGASAGNWRTIGGKKVRTTMGIVTALDRYGATSGDDQSIFTITEASYKYGNFVDDMEKVFRYYPNTGEKYALCGPGAISYWSKLDSNFVKASNFQVKIGSEQQDGTFGFNVRRMETPHGVLNLVNTPALRGPYNKYMVVLSDENLQFVQYRPDSFNANILTDNGYDGVKDEYFSDCGLGLQLIESHKLFKIV